MKSRIEILAAADNAAALQLWEASVRASHDFVAEEDIVFFRELVRGALEARGADFYGIYGEQGLLAFMAVDGQCEMLEMLFVAPEERGKGYGSALVRHALGALKVRRVDVNEDNALAKRFYEREGFMVMARSELDGTGRPYPLLHMEFIPQTMAQS